MSVDKFGRSSFHLQQKHGFFEVSREDEEVINAKKRRIINLEKPLEKMDATNKKYVDKTGSDLKLVINELSEQILTLKNDIENIKVNNTLLKNDMEEHIINSLIKSKTSFFDIFKTYYKTENLAPRRTLEEKSSVSADVVTVSDFQEIFEVWLMNN
jgi:hypothetical protein